MWKRFLKPLWGLMVSRVLLFADKCVNYKCLRKWVKSTLASFCGRIISVSWCGQRKGKSYMNSFHANWIIIAMILCVNLCRVFLVNSAQLNGIIIDWSMSLVKAVHSVKLNLQCHLTMNYSFGKILPAQLKRVPLGIPFSNLLWFCTAQWWAVE